MSLCTPVPSTLVFRLVRNRQSAEVHSEIVRFRNKLVQLSVFRVTPRMVHLTPRIGKHAAMDLGTFPDGNSFVRLYGKSLLLADFQAVFESRPLVVCVSVENGKKPDTLQPKWKLATSLAFASMDDYAKVRLRALKHYDDHRPAKDAQQTRLYNWEGSFLDPALRADRGWQRTKEAKLKQIAEAVIAQYDVPQDRVHITTAPARSARRLGVCQTFRDDAAAFTPTFVVVNVHDSTPDTMIHELGHLVVTFHYNRADRIQGHGPEFCGVYAHLLAQFGPFNEKRVILSMREAGLKVLPIRRGPLARFVATGHAPAAVV